MSSGVDRYVTELSTECTQSVYPGAGAHVHEVSTTEQSVASIEQRTSLSHSSSYRRNENYIPKEFREWQHIPNVDNVSAKFQANHGADYHSFATFAQSLRSRSNSLECSDAQFCGTISANLGSILQYRICQDSSDDK